MFRLAKEPQGLGRILGDGFRLFNAGLLGALRIMLLMIVCGIVIIFFIGAIIGAASALFMGGASIQHLSAFSVGGMLIQLLIFLVEGLFISYFFTAVILYYANLCTQSQTSIRAAMSDAISRFLPLFGAAVIYIFILALLFAPSYLYQLNTNEKIAAGEVSLVTVGIVKLILQIPYIIFATTLVFSVYRAALDNCAPFSAVISSHKLVWDYFWRTLVWLIILNFMLGVIFLFIFTLTTGFDFSSGQGVAAVVAASPLRGLSALILFLIFLFPFIAAMTIPYYHDLKLRKYGGNDTTRIFVA